MASLLTSPVSYLASPQDALTVDTVALVAGNGASPQDAAAVALAKLAGAVLLTTTTTNNTHTNTDTDTDTPTTAAEDGMTKTAEGSKRLDKKDDAVAQATLDMFTTEQKDKDAVARATAIATEVMSQKKRTSGPLLVIIGGVGPYASALFEQYVFFIFFYFLLQRMKNCAPYYLLHTNTNNPSCPHTAYCYNKHKPMEQIKVIYRHSISHCLNLLVIVLNIY